MQFKTETLHPALMPRRQTLRAAGYDVHSPTAIKLMPNSMQRIDLQFSIIWPLLGNYHALLLARSSLANRAVSVLGGLIDADYCGNLGLLLFNHSQQTIELQEGDRVAQLVFYEHTLASSDIQPTHVRGFGGFGSTGN